MPAVVIMGQYHMKTKSQPLGCMARTRPLVGLCGGDALAQEVAQKLVAVATPSSGEGEQIGQLVDDGSRYLPFCTGVEECEESGDADADEVDVQFAIDSF